MIINYFRYIIFERIFLSKILFNRLSLIKCLEEVLADIKSRKFIERAVKPD